MLFNTLSFLLFFPLTTAVYFALPHRRRWAFLLACSTLFYSGWIIVASERAPWAWLYLLVLAFVILVDYLAGLAIDATKGSLRRLCLIASLLANVGILGIFKYFTFLNVNFHALAQFLHFNFPVRNLGLLLPIGLSFHTFQSMSYTIEVYLGRQRAERHLGIYALYVMFYPQLVAGPIERPQNLLHQLRAYHEFDTDRIFSGLRLMLWGFFKKVVIADRLAAIVDPIYRDPHAWGSAYLWLATYFFAFQIYCDFAGYCDIAIGAARVLGIKLMDNFDRPYAARSVAEFWRRWHISLSTWFRDYLYFPLGGNRVKLPRWCFNILLVFLISGLWHGASWTFVMWGALHGAYVIIERVAWNLRRLIFLHPVLRGRAGVGVSASGAIGETPILTLPRSTGRGKMELPRNAIASAIKISMTFNLVAIAWVFFRASSLSQAELVLSRILHGPLLARPAVALGSLPPFTLADIVLCVLLIVFLEFVQWASANRRWSRAFDLQSARVRWPVYYALIVTILTIGQLGARSFIYFQF